MLRCKFHGSLPSNHLPSVRGPLARLLLPASLLWKLHRRSHLGGDRNPWRAAIVGCASATGDGRSALFSRRRAPERKGSCKSSRVTPTSPDSLDTAP